MKSISGLKKRWRAVAYPAAILALLYLLVFLAFGQYPLINRVAVETARGSVPDVAFTPSPWLFLLIGVFLLLVGLIFHALRAWSQYFLSRKMFLSYLFFACMPLATAVLIFFALTRVVVGVSSLLTFEQAIDRNATELRAFSDKIIVLLQEHGHLSHETAEEAVQTALREGGRQTLGRGLQVQVLWLGNKTPGVPRLMVPTYPKPDVSKGAFYREHSAAYERIMPSWMGEEQSWTGMINRNGRLFLRHLSLDKNILVLTTQPLDQRFIDSISGFQIVRVSLESQDGNTMLSTSRKTSSWISLIPILNPFTTHWDSGAFDWESGFFEYWGRVTFGLELSHLSLLVGESGLLAFFYAGQKASSAKVIISVLMLVLACVLCALIFSALLVRHITRCLNFLADGHERIASGRLEYRTPYFGKDQLGAMGKSFNNMIENIQMLMRESAEKEKYHEELRIARDIQMGLLPNVHELKWCTNIAADCKPARDVGGDYYEILRTESGEIGIFIADVSGKGTSAAFYMAELKGVLIALRHLWGDPKELMSTVNEIMRGTLSSNVFISASYLLLDPLTNLGHLARAGHCPAFHITNKGKVTELTPPGMAIGLAGSKIFDKVMEVATFPLSVTDKVLLYTDGLDEMTHHHEMYGLDRLKRVLIQYADLTPEELKQQILADVLRFLSDSEQNDDLTLVIAGLPQEVTEPVAITAQA